MNFTKQGLKRGYSIIMSDRLYVISGVTGMTGNELARQLIARNDYIIGFDNFFASSIYTVDDIIKNELFEFYEYDINNQLHMESLYKRTKEKMKDMQQTIFINCAAVVHTEYFYHINSTFETNVIAMKKFLDAAISLGCNQYINCSTSEVYSMKSFNESGGVKESDNILLATAEQSQRTSYASGKLLTEFFLKDAVDNNKIKGCSIRFANVYSKNEKYAKHIIPHIINSFIEKIPLKLFNNSKVNKRTFLHNIDSCSAVLTLSDNEDSLDGTIYNVATDEEITIIALAEMIAKKMNVTDMNIVFEGYRTADPERRLLNTDKLKNATDWSPVIDLSKGLDMCISYAFQNNQRRLN